MAVTAPREKWTDERLDDLNAKVEKGFADTKDVIAETKAEMREGFARLEARIENAEARSDTKFGELHQRFDRLQQTLIGATVAIAVAIIGSNIF